MSVLLEVILGKGILLWRLNSSLFVQSFWQKSSLIQFYMLNICFFPSKSEFLLLKLFSGKL